MAGGACHSRRTWASWPTPAPRSWQTSCGCPRSQSWCSAPAGVGRAQSSVGTGQQAAPGAWCSAPSSLPHFCASISQLPSYHCESRHGLSLRLNQPVRRSPITPHIIVGVGLVQLSKVGSILLHRRTKHKHAKMRERQPGAGRRKRLHSAQLCTRVLQPAACHLTFMPTRPMLRTMSLCEICRGGDEQGRRGRWCSRCGRGRHGHHLPSKRFPSPPHILIQNLVQNGHISLRQQLVKVGLDEVDHLQGSGGRLAANALAGAHGTQAALSPGTC